MTKQPQNCIINQLDMQHCNQPVIKTRSKQFKNNKEKLFSLLLLECIEVNYTSLNISISPSVKKLYNVYSKETVMKSMIDKISYQVL
jgi:hypothetical protein